MEETGLPHTPFTSKVTEYIYVLRIQASHSFWAYTWGIKVLALEGGCVALVEEE
jgi:hypothetical protein